MKQAVLPMPKPLQQKLRQLAHYQRRLVKKVKRSKGYYLLKTKIARLHKWIADIRRKCRDHNASVNLENYTARSAGIYAAGYNGSVLAV